MPAKYADLQILFQGVVRIWQNRTNFPQKVFQSPSHFYATFKAETGMTPSQYLEKIA